MATPDPRRDLLREEVQRRRERRAAQGQSAPSSQLSGSQPATNASSQGSSSNHEVLESLGLLNPLPTIPSAREPRRGHTGHQQAGQAAGAMRAEGLGSQRPELWDRLQVPGPQVPASNFQVPYGPSRPEQTQPYAGNSEASGSRAPAPESKAAGKRPQHEVTPQSLHTGHLPQAPEPVHAGNYAQQPNSIPVASHQQHEVPSRSVPTGNWPQALNPLPAAGNYAQQPTSIPGSNHHQHKVLPQPIPPGSHHQAPQHHPVGNYAQQPTSIPGHNHHQHQAPPQSMPPGHYAQQPASIPSGNYHHHEAPPTAQSIHTGHHHQASEYMHATNHHQPQEAPPPSKPTEEAPPPYTPKDKDQQPYTLPPWPTRLWTSFTSAISAAASIWTIAFKIARTLFLIFEAIFLRIFANRAVTYVLCTITDTLIKWTIVALLTIGIVYKGPAYLSLDVCNLPTIPLPLVNEVIDGVVHAIFTCDPIFETTSDTPEFKPDTFTMKPLIPPIHKLVSDAIDTLTSKSTLIKFAPLTPSSDWKASYAKVIEEVAALDEEFSSVQKSQHGRIANFLNRPDPKPALQTWWKGPFNVPLWMPLQVQTADLKGILQEAMRNSEGFYSVYSLKNGHTIYAKFEDPKVAEYIVAGMSVHSSVKLFTGTDLSVKDFSTALDNIYATSFILDMSSKKMVKLYEVRAQFIGEDQEWLVAQVTMLGELELLMSQGKVDVTEEWVASRLSQNIEVAREWKRRVERYFVDYEKEGK